MKKCNRCKEILPTECFAKNKSRRDGLQGMCRKCKKIVDAKHHLENREAQNARNKANRQIRLDLVKQMKSVPCMDCGNTYMPFVMDFDHVRGVKICEISIMASNSVSMKTLLAEIEKCDVVCANCHRIRTWNRNNASVV